MHIDDELVETESNGKLKTVFIIFQLTYERFL